MDKACPFLLLLLDSALVAMRKNKYWANCTTSSLTYLNSESLISTQACPQGCSPPGDKGFRTLLAVCAFLILGRIFSGVVAARVGSKLGLDEMAVRGVRKTSEPLEVDASESEGVESNKDDVLVRSGKLGGSDAAGSADDVGASSILNGFCGATG